MPPAVLSPRLAIACQAGNDEEVQERIDAGDNPLELVVTQFPNKGGPPGASPYTQMGISLHFACQRLQPKCVSLLVAQDDAWPQLDHQRRLDGATPLLVLCERLADVSLDRREDFLDCVRLLLDAGCSLEPRTRGRRGRRSRPGGLRALDMARLTQSATPVGVKLVRMLEEAEALRWSRATHDRFPRPARAYAASLLRVGYQVADGALVPFAIWKGRIMPLLVTRTSRLEQKTLQFVEAPPHVVKSAEARLKPSRLEILRLRLVRFVERRYGLHRARALNNMLRFGALPFAGVVGAVVFVLGWFVVRRLA